MKVSSFVVSTILCLVVLSHSTESYAQARASAKQQAISANVLGLFLDGKELHAQYEWKSTPVNSWFIRGLFGSFVDYDGLGVGAGYRFFIADSRALTGLAIAPVVHAYFWRHQYLDSEIFFSVGGEASYKWIFDDFLVEPMFGLGIGFGGDYISYLSSTRWYLGIMLGYAW